MPLSADQYFVNAVRAVMGLGPLYGVDEYNQTRSFGYWGYEELCQLAKPDCSSCGGSGYVFRDEREQPCACTGRVYAKRGNSMTPKAVKRREERARKKAQHAQP